jgi:hypothetical protein
MDERTGRVPKSWRSAVLLLLPAAVVGCSEDGGGLPYCGDLRVLREPILNGVDGPEPSVVALSADQARAVGFLNLGGTHACTGTLVAPGVVLTAAHCLRFDPPTVTFSVGRNWRSPTATYDAAAWHSHPDYRVGEVDRDLAVVLLARDPTADGVVPLPVHLAPPQRLTGQVIQAAGYGYTSYDDTSNSILWWVVLDVTREDPVSYIARGDGTTGTCTGDSGGPLLWTHPDGGVRVFGALSLGEAGTRCLGDSYYVRTDEPANADFVRGFLPADPCAGETAAGRCEGTGVAVYCADGAVHRDTCAAGESCGENAAGELRCLAEGPCEAEGLDWIGTCTPDGHARWCDGGRVMDRDCPGCGQSCGWAGAASGWYCVNG